MPSDKEIGSPGPFEVKFQDAPTPSPAPRARNSLAIAQQQVSPTDRETQVATLEPPRRRYDCENYETCLNLAAALNWSSFTCRGCNGKVNETMYWRAHQIQRRDSVARALCDLPPISALEGSKETDDGGDEDTSECSDKLDE